MTNVYKFRALGTEIDFCRIREILETGNFWCSKFFNLNDPMEGVYTTSEASIIDIVLQNKLDYKICSFSGPIGFKQPLMWGHYANGFKGVAIKVSVKNEVAKQKIKPVKYPLRIPYINDVNDVKNIFNNKLNPWELENEYRFLEKDNENLQKIGHIKAIYFGDPYGNVVNQNKILEKNKNLLNYYRYQNKLKKIAHNLGIKCYLVQIKNCEVVVTKELLLDK